MTDSPTASQTSAPPAKPVQYRGTVKAMRSLISDIRHIDIAVSEPGPIAFRPGQSIRLRIPTAPGQKELFRNYSFASPPHESDHLELIIRRVPKGVGTGWIFEQLQVGMEVQFVGPFGRFGLSDTTLPMVWIAGGSGIAPFYSMLRHMHRTGIHRPCRLFFGAPSSDGLVLVDQMRRFEAQLDGFQYVPVVDSPAPGWTGQTGLVTAAVERCLAPDQPCEAYICGAPGMVAAAKTLLQAKGVPAERIFTDSLLGQDG